MSRLGCQPSWHYYNTTQIPICYKINDIKERYYHLSGTVPRRNYYRPADTYAQTLNTSTRFAPCKRTSIRYEAKHKITWIFKKLFILNQQKVILQTIEGQGS